MLQAAAAIHVGVDNFCVVRHVDRLTRGIAPCASHDGDVFHLVKKMLNKRERGLTG